MSKKKKSFILYDDDIACISHLTIKQSGKLLQAIVNLRINGEVPDFGDDAALKILFHQITSHISMNEEKYKIVCEQRALSAKKRWDTKEHMQNDANACKPMQMHANAYKAMQSDANRCYNDNDNDNDNGIDIDNVNDMDNDIENGASAPTSYNCAEPPDITVDSLLAKYRKILAERSS